MKKDYAGGIAWGIIGFLAYGVWSVILDLTIKALGG